MIQLDYVQLVRAFCEEVGLQDWEEIAQARHVEVDGVTVGLLHDEEQAADVLSLCFDLGPVHDAGIFPRLLAYNATCPADDGGTGQFGILPESDTLTYRIDMPWRSPLTGAELALQVGKHVDTARAALSACNGA